MRIDSSSVTMASTSDYTEKNTKEESLRTWTGDRRPDFEGIGGQRTPAAAQAAPQPLVRFALPGYIVELSDEGKKASLAQADTNAAGAVMEGSDIFDDLGDADRQKLLMLQRMLERLTGRKFKFFLLDKASIRKLRADPSLNATRLDSPIRLDNPTRLDSPIRPDQPVRRSTPQRQGWGLEFDSHELHYEKQSMSFDAKGIVRTSDGREIDFSLQLNMSREFTSSRDVSIRAGDAVLKDPLVINFGTGAAGLSQQKISFDLDMDGSSEQMSFLSQGSGFLALDLNGDGVVNDGSELFGPQSGDGFRDLSAYDGDKNGWIDENDDIYSKLRIWTKDADGTDRLLALGQKGIGAIYLGNAATSFDLKDSSNNKLGDIGSTGVFLREDGTAGTIQHIDLAI